MKKEMNTKRKKFDMIDKKSKKKPFKKTTGDKFKKKALKHLKLEDMPNDKEIETEDNLFDDKEIKTDVKINKKPLKSILKKDKATDESFVNKKKSFKRKSEGSTDDSPNKKVKACEMKFKARKEMRKKQQDKKYGVVKNLKELWEELRREDCPVTKKTDLLNKICSIVKGHVKEFAYAHDTVRVLECVIMEGAEEHRSLLFEEMKDEIILMSKSKYAKHFLFKILKYGSKKQKEAIMTSFHGSVTKLMKHTEAAQVVEMAFNECANAKQRFQMVQEFYGASYRFFKESEIHNLSHLLENKPETKASVISSMKEQLMKVLEKSVVKHSLIHSVLLQFFLNCDPASRSEIIESLKEVVPEILHTKDGSRVAMHCVWHGTNKDRKVIIKHMKTFVSKIAMEEHGHMVLLAVFDCVDDTKVIEKVIIKELQENLLELAQNVHGKKVLVYLLNPRDSHFFHPDVVNILKGGDNNAVSKKDPEIRRQELKVAIANPLIDLVAANISTLYKNNAFGLFTVTILKHTVGDKKRGFEAVARIAAEPYTTENKNVHIIENPGSYFMLKQLIRNDANKNTDDVTFSEVLVRIVPDGVMKTWFRCNRGAFILVGLMETELPAVIKRVKEELTGCNKQLDKLTFRGAEILKKKLKEHSSVNTSV